MGEQAAEDPLLSCLPFLPSLPEKGRLFFGMGGLE
jgi:hypothetical protein